MHRGKALKRTLQTLESLLEEPRTILCLQEMGVRGFRIGEIAAAWLGANLHQRGGNAILTRLPIVEVGQVLLSAKPKLNNIWANVEIAPGVHLRVYSLHLSYKRATVNIFIRGIRGAEMGQVVENVAQHQGPAVVAGDFNTVGYILGGHGNEPAIGALRSAGFADMLASSPGLTQIPLGRLDWIFARGMRPLESALGKFRGSDHRWIKAVVEHAPLADGAGKDTA